MAGQLHVYDTTLGSVDFALLVKVVAVGAKGRARTVKAVVERCFSRNTNACEFKEQTQSTFELYPGVLWDDERRSPIDHRYWDRASQPPKVGQRVLLVPTSGRQFEAVERTPERVKKFEFFFGEVPVDQALQRLEVPELFAALRDLDLFDAAQSELASRGALSPEAIVALPLSDHFERLLAVVHKSQPAEQGLLWLDALATAAVNAAPATRLRVLHWLLYQQHGWVAVVELLLTCDPRVALQLSALSEWVSTLQAHLKTDEAFAPQTSRFLKHYVPFRPGHHDYLDLIESTAAALPPDQRVELIAALAQVLISPPPNAVRQPFDGALFDQVLRVVERFPAARNVGVVAQLPIDHPAHFTRLMNALFATKPVDEAALMAIRERFERHTVLARYPYDVPVETSSAFVALEGWGRLHGLGPSPAGLADLISARAEAEWNERWKGGSPGWRVRTSPPLPSQWPLQPQGRVVTYVFATKNADVSAPLGRIEYATDHPETLIFTPLIDHVEVVRAASFSEPPTENNRDWQNVAHWLFLAVERGASSRFTVASEYQRWCAAAQGLTRQIYGHHQAFWGELGDDRAFRPRPGE